MTVWPKDNSAALDAFYTRPDGTAKWEVTNLVYITAPWRIYIPETRVELLRGIRVHKKVAESLSAIFKEIWMMYGQTQEAIEAVDLHKMGGAYYFRQRRGSGRLSNHAYGCAIDIDPLDNPFKGNRGDMPQKVVDVFVSHGWKWGGVYGDPMHFEAVDNGGFKPSSQVKPVVPYTDSEAEIDAWVAIQHPKSKVEELFVATRYWDFGQWSIGYGSNADKLPDGTVWTEPQAAEDLRKRLKMTATKVAQAVSVKLTPGQGAALLSFADNCGIGALQSSTLLKKLNAGDYIGASNRFGDWVKATVDGKRVVLGGLVKRRAREKEMFLTT